LTPRWSTRDIPDLSGKTAVVTGANSGLGYETALALARAGAQVVLACRDKARGEEAAERIARTVTSDRTVTSGRTVTSASPELEQLDLASLSSVRDFATRFSSRHASLDILVNNAGVMAIPRRETADGFEMQFGTNHLGHFALTGLLLDALLARAGSRVVTVSSEVARIGRIRFDDLQGTRHYWKWVAYGQSKLANQLFTLELDRRAGDKGIVSVAAHPGYSATNLQGVGPRMAGSKLMERITELENSLFSQTAEMGALPTLYGATADGVKGGQYFGPDGPFAMHGYPKQVSFVHAARNPDTAKRLWEVSEELTGVRFEALGRS
jgi:NAD(P)-dependent dehydrogenase (short-subunit alcohol dehydrogenase family)